MDGGEIAKIALGSGVLSAILSTGISWFKESRKESFARKQSAKQSAIKLISLLEMYALEISEQIYMNEMAFVWFDDDGAMKAVDAKFRAPPKAPSEIDLSLLPQAIVTTFVWLEAETFLSSAYMKAVWENAHLPGDGVDEFAEVSGHLGYKALMCAESLRKSFALPKIAHFSYEHHAENLSKKNSAYLKRMSSRPS